MSTINVSELIKQLSKQVNLEAMATRDLVATLSDLYTKTEKLETELTYARELATTRGQAQNKAEAALAAYTTPLAKLEADQKKLDTDRLRFDIEKEYLKREIQIYREMVASLTLSMGKNVSQSTGNNGGYYNETMQFNKPGFPSGELK